MTGAPRAPSPVQEITDPGLGHVTFDLIMKRDDLISAHFPGSNWRKLAGVAAGLADGQRAIGFSPLRGGSGEDAAARQR
jgi:1-aminocyclopropane-1-carboxylate deaminase/D-cysteine desulfhydrase-like pyridoxal-dependent ACC family enzyme